MATVHTLELKKDGKISYGGDAALITGTITTIKAPAILAHSFKFAGSDESATRVTCEIKPIEDSMCSLTMSHTRSHAKEKAFADITGDRRWFATNQRAETELA